MVFQWNFATQASNGLHRGRNVNRILSRTALKASGQKMEPRPWQRINEKKKQTWHSMAHLHTTRLRRKYSIFALECTSARKHIYGMVMENEMTHFLRMR